MFANNFAIYVTQYCVLVSGDQSDFSVSTLDHYLSFALTALRFDKITFKSERVLCAIFVKYENFLN